MASAGATLVAFAFIIPSFIMVIALAWLYLHFGGLSWMQGAFYGIGAAVIAIIARSAWKLTRTSLGHDYLLWSLFGFSALVTAWTESEIVWLFLLSGTAAMGLRARRPMAATGLLILPPWLFSGLLAATLTTLTVLPAIYGVLQRRASTKSPSLNPNDPESRYYVPNPA